MSAGYVQTRNGNLYVGNSRVTLDSVILLWKQGLVPEVIQADFPSLPLAAIYGTIAYYLDHQTDADQFLRRAEELRQAQRTAAEAADPERLARLRERFAVARDRLGLSAQDTAPTGPDDQTIETKLSR